MKYFAKWILLYLFLWMSTASIVLAESRPDQDTLLKAAFIYKFTKFIHWPEHVKPNSLVLCTLGDDKLVDVIVNNIAPNQKIRVKPVLDKSAIDNCQILYIASSEQGSYRSLDVIIRNTAILTISELPGFVESGGIVELTYEANRIRFDINLDAARQNGLEISSGLLKLARKVKWDSKP